MKTAIRRLLSGAQRRLRLLLLLALLLLWLVDLEVTQGLRDEQHLWWPMLVSGPVVATLALLPERWLSLQWRAWLAGLGSLVLSGLLTLRYWETAVSPSGVEAVCLLILLVRVCRLAPRPSAAAALTAALIALPFQVGHDVEALSYAFLYTFAAGGAIGLGSYLRTLDGRRASAVADVRREERLELARDLHDFVAHHVTGIVVQANAARAVQHSSPAQVATILNNIEQSGSATLQSMRRLVRVLRDDEGHTQRTGELDVELAELVSHSVDCDEQEVRLQVAAAARQAEPAPEVATSVYRVVQEALTNVRRHAPGAATCVRLDVADGQLRVEVRNGPAATRVTQPAGGRGGLGLVGLHERVTAVDGTLSSGSTKEGGWSLTAAFPLGEDGTATAPAAREASA